jgi:uncharacterized repeat protein (TIGR03803 family)
MYEEQTSVSIIAMGKSYAESSFMKRSATLVLLLLSVLLGAAGAQTENVLNSFCVQGNCTDGSTPYAGLVIDQKGNLYGTTDAGGAYGGGVLFKLTPKGKETVLHSFCAHTNCTDGAQPVAGLIIDQSGNLYGTTYYGGRVNSSSCLSGRIGCGVIFKLTPEGEETVLHSFCTENNCTDGELPLAGLVFDQKGNLYGTTDAGGAYGYGVVFKLTPEGKETVLYSFCARGGSSCTDGRHPSAGLFFDQWGNLYGTTEYGGAYGGGIVFKLTPKGKERVLYSFCGHDPPYCTDGVNPLAGVVLDQKGNLYGTTYFGGAYGFGLVFKVTPKGKETALYSFCPQDPPFCADGSNPLAGLVFDQNGNLYGTTEYGGHAGGVIFKLTPKGEETVLYSFCGQTNCTDGSTPYAGLVIDQKGNLYGTTYAGGTSSGCNGYGCGVVFKVTP